MELFESGEVKVFLDTLSERANHSYILWSAILVSGTIILFLCISAIAYLSASSVKFLDINQPAIYALAIFSIFTILTLIVSSSGSRWSDANYVSKNLKEISADLALGNSDRREIVRRLVQLSTYMDSKGYMLGPINFKDTKDENETCLCNDKNAVL